MISKIHIINLLLIYLDRFISFVIYATSSHFQSLKDLWQISASLSAKLYKNQTSRKLHSCFKLNVINSTCKYLISFQVQCVSIFRASSLFLADQFWHHFKISNCSTVSFICLRVIFSFLRSVGKPYDINKKVVEVKQIRCH